jgi:elongation factor P hydroxylase
VITNKLKKRFGNMEKFSYLYIVNNLKQNKMETTQTEFEKLPENEQAFRWRLFVESNGYEKNLSKKQIKEIAKQYGVEIN